MPIFDRDLLVDRPTVISPLVNTDDEEEQSADSGDREKRRRKSTKVETLGDGGGPTVHELEFEDGQDSIIKASNLVAFLSTGQEGGEVYSELFKNAAFQLLQVEQNGHTFDDVVSLSEDLNVAYIGYEEGESESDEEPDPDPEPEEEAEEDQEDGEDSYKEFLEDGEEEEDEDEETTEE